MKYAILLFCIYFCSCKNNKVSTNKSVFEIPVIINSRLLNLKSIDKRKFKLENINGSNPTFIGKFKFKDSIDINPKFKKYSYTFSSREEYEKNDKDLKEASLSGLELIVDYETTAYYNWDGNFPDSDLVFAYYPIYLVNSTKSNKILYGKNNDIFGIQEAVDKENFDSWKPIEGKAFDFCGNGSWKIVIKPNEFGLALMKKYEGNYTTELRTRIENNYNIIVSNGYLGKINRKQFKVKDSSSMQRRLIKSDGSDNTFSLFYGAELN